MPNPLPHLRKWRSNSTEYKALDRKGSDSSALYAEVRSLSVYNGVLYRGMSGLTEKQYATLISGTITLDSLTSFSKDIHVGVKYASLPRNGRNVLISVSKGKGYSLGLLSYKEKEGSRISFNEKEVLLLKGTRLRVRKVTSHPLLPENAVLIHCVQESVVESVRVFLS